MIRFFAPLVTLLPLSVPMPVLVLVSVPVPVFVFAFVFMSAPLSANAEPWRCDFTTECIAGAACAATDWYLDVIAADHEGQLFAATMFSEVPVTRLPADRDATTISYAGEDQLITVQDNGIAQLSRHGDIAVTYFGTCEVLE